MYDTDYNCHITAVELFKPINHMGFMSRHTTPLVINSLGGGHTQTHTHRNIIDVLTEIIFKKPGTRQPQNQVYTLKQF